MSNRPRIPSLDDQYCQVCSSSSSDINIIKHLSCFSCDHCGLSMCYGCYEKHKNQLTNGKHSNQVINENSGLQDRYSYLKKLLDNQQQYFSQYQEHCIRNINAAFDEVFNDLENLRHECVNYVKKQCHDAEINLLEVMKTAKPMTTKAEQNWTRDGLVKSTTMPSDMEQAKILDVEKILDLFSSPIMQIKMSTYPRNKLNLQCQLLPNSFASIKKFSSNHPGKTIRTRCSYGKITEISSDKIEVETHVEELDRNMFDSKQTQTDQLIHLNYDIDDNDEDIYLHDETERLNYRIDMENCLSRRFSQTSSIYTQNEVDRIASDGEHALYYSDTSKSLCYITNLLSAKNSHSQTVAKEISCRWSYQSILDLIYSPTSSRYVCATKSGVYTCNVTNSVIDIKMQFIQNCSYVRLASDHNYIWIWTDTPRTNELRIYSPRTFDCIKIFNLNDYPRFMDNSTTFCIYENTLATLFQFKSLTNMLTSRKMFHLTLSDRNDLHELCTIRLGECDIDHEIRTSNSGFFFITNGRKKLWIVDQSGRKEYVKLNRIGRALAVLNRNHVLIANGTQQLQCVEFLHQ